MCRFITMYSVCYEFSQGMLILQDMQDGFGKCVDFNAIIEGHDSVCDQHTTAVGKLNS